MSLKNIIVLTLIINIHIDLILLSILFFYSPILHVLLQTILFLISSLYSLKR